MRGKHKLQIINSLLKNTVSLLKMLHKLIFVLWNLLLVGCWSVTAADSSRQFTFDNQDSSNLYRQGYAGNIYATYPYTATSSGIYGNLNNVGYGYSGLLGYPNVGGYGLGGYTNLGALGAGGLGYGGQLGYTGLGGVGVLGYPGTSVGLYPNYYGNQLLGVGGAGIQGFSNPYLYNRLYGNLLKK